MSINVKINEVKANLKEAIHLISNEKNYHLVADKIMDALVGIGVLESQLQEKIPTIKNNSESDEIVKVSRKLKLWSKKPEQISSKILKAYIKLKPNDLAVSPSLELLEERCLEYGINSKQFNTNFSQMTVISPKNHGKIFDVINGKVEVWDKVKDSVLQFKKDTSNLSD